MNPQPLRIRVLSALHVAPMTVSVLSRALSANHWAIRSQLYRLLAMQAVAASKAPARHKGRPELVYRIAA